MDVFVKKVTKTGNNVYHKISNAEIVYIFDDTKARFQINGDDCCVRTPVKPKNLDIYVELE